MSSRDTHAVAAMMLAGAGHAYLDAQAGRRTLDPLLIALLASQMGSLPDALEPATSPNHRDFFHSVTFGTIVIMATLKASQWTPTDPAKQCARALAIAAGTAFVSHLCMDATTPKSIPLIGRHWR